MSIYVEVHVQSSPNFWSMLLLTVAQSSSGGVIIHYVLPVLWMTSYLHNVQKQATWKDYYYATSVQRPLSRTTWLSRYQKGKTSLHLNKARDYGVLGCSGISWTVCKQCAPNSRQIITPTPHTHPFNGSLSGTTRASRYQKGKPIWILLKQETVSGSGISWAICKSAPCSR